MEMIEGSPPPLGPMTNPTCGAAPGVRSQRVYRVARGGTAIVAASLGIDIAAVRQRIRTGSREFAAHSLEVVNAAIVFGSAALRHPGRRGEPVQPEPLVSRS